MAIGLYIHVPFCLSKCPYCDFYSLAGQDAAAMDAYTAAMEQALDRWSARLGLTADTLYFGGGTPSLLGGARLVRLVEHAARRFGLSGAEITLEANPADDLDDTLRAFAAAGGNRLSMGMQSASGEELRRLGRRHTPVQLERAMDAAARAGLSNVSLDLMLGISGQTPASAEQSVRTCARLGARHVSAYLLKIEEGTPYASRRDALDLPDEDAAAALYETAGAALEAAGYRQYEISNFAQPGYESRHNLKYWDEQPYLGLGPSAHSFLDGRRFYFPRDMTAFLAGKPPLPEAEDDSTIPENSPEEYLMLRLRLAEGVTEAGYAARFGQPLPANWRRRAAALPRELVLCDETGIRLTRRGFLLSNAILARLLG